MGNGFRGNGCFLGASFSTAQVELENAYISNCRIVGTDLTKLSGLTAGGIVGYPTKTKLKDINLRNIIIDGTKNVLEFSDFGCLVGAKLKQQDAGIGEQLTLDIQHTTIDGCTVRTAGSKSHLGILFGNNVKQRFKVGVDVLLNDFRFRKVSLIENDNTVDDAVFTDYQQGNEAWHSYKPTP